MNDPWEGISLSDYEGHMSDRSVMQLQTLNSIMKEQIAAFPAECVIILGIAGGNGLEHTAGFKKVYAVDINQSYLDTARERHGDLGGAAEYLRIDLNTEYEKLPSADLIIADLLIEYIGCDSFLRCVQQAGACHVSCVIQENIGDGYVSATKYAGAFDCLDQVHRDIGREELIACMEGAGFRRVLCGVHPLPNGKRLVRLDFSREVNE